MFTNEEKQRIVELEKQAQDGDRMSVYGCIGLFGLYVVSSMIPPAAIIPPVLGLTIAAVGVSSLVAASWGTIKKFVAVEKHKNLVLKSFDRELNKMTKSFSNESTLSLKCEISNLYEKQKELTSAFKDTCEKINKLEQSMESIGENHYANYRALIDSGKKQYEQIVANHEAINENSKKLTDILVERSSQFSSFGVDIASNNSNMSLRMSERSFIRRIEKKFDRLRHIFSGILNNDRNNHEVVENFKFKDKRYYKAQQLYNKHIATPQKDLSESKSREQTRTVPKENNSERTKNNSSFDKANT